MRKVIVSATQMSCSNVVEENIKKAEENVRSAVKNGANIVLIQELFETEYFCKKHKFEYLDLSTTVEENKAINHFKNIAKELNVVIPISFYEKCGNTAFNSIAIIDADGENLGVYRKTHIPDGLPYGEKFFFSPGDTGFKAWDTKFGKIGVGICWDQWFPECARSMALLGAEILLYPTAIGSEPFLTKDSKNHWQNAMKGHSASNIMPVIASNRVGTEIDEDMEITFYGSSFITNQYGEIVAEADRTSQAVITYEFDLDEIAKERREWGVFRDRRPEMYGKLLTH